MRRIPSFIILAAACIATVGIAALANSASLADRRGPPARAEPCVAAQATGGRPEVPPKVDLSAPAADPDASCSRPRGASQRR